MLALAGIGLISYLLNGQMFRIAHPTWVFWALEFPGTVLHETLHYAACLVLQVPVRDVNFKLRPEPGEPYGFVVHQNAGFFKNQLIGLAPLAGSTALILVLSSSLLSRGLPWTRVPVSGWSYLFLFLAFLVALGMCPSREDLAMLPEFLILGGMVMTVLCIALDAVSRESDITGFTRPIVSALMTIRNRVLFVLGVLAFTFAAIVLVRLLAAGLARVRANRRAYVAGRRGSRRRVDSPGSIGGRSAAAGPRREA